MSEIKLGDKVRDTISGFEGIVVAICDWLSGCRRITISPQELHDGKPVGDWTFDANQLELISRGAVAKEPVIGGGRDNPTRNADPK